MGQRQGVWLRWLAGASFALAFACGAPALAQSSAQDEAAREHFEAGRTAFEQADYESALRQFREAHRLSGRPALWYNIGVAAERLQRDEEALRAFERYLEQTERPTRESEVRQKLAALRRRVEEKQAAQQVLLGAGPTAGDADFGIQRSQDQAPSDKSVGKKKWPWIVAAVASVAAAGVATGLVLSQRSEQDTPSGGLKVNW